MSKHDLDKIDELVIEVLGYYAEDIFTPPTDEDRQRFNQISPNAHTRIYCDGIRHGLHMLRRAARGLEARDDLPVLHVPGERKALRKLAQASTKGIKNE